MAARRGISRVARGEPRLPASVVGEPYAPVEPSVVSVTHEGATVGDGLRAPVSLRSRPDTPVTDVEAI